MPRIRLGVARNRRRSVPMLRAFSMFCGMWTKGFEACLTEDSALLRWLFSRPLRLRAQWRLPAWRRFCWSIVRNREIGVMFWRTFFSSPSLLLGLDSSRRLRIWVRQRTRCTLLMGWGVHRFLTKWCRPWRFCSSPEWRGCIPTAKSQKRL